MNNTMTVAEQFEAIRAKIYAADAAGRSVSTMNRLWKKYFVLETALKAQSGGY